MAKCTIAPTENDDVAKSTNVRIKVDAGLRKSRRRTFAAFADFARGNAAVVVKLKARESVRI